MVFIYLVSTCGQTEPQFVEAFLHILCLIFLSLCPSFSWEQADINTVVVITSTPAIQDVFPKSIRSLPQTKLFFFVCVHIHKSEMFCATVAVGLQLQTKTAWPCCVETLVAGAAPPVWAVPGGRCGRGNTGWNTDTSLSRYLCTSGTVNGVSPFKPLLSTYRRHPELKPCLCCSVSH